MKNHEIIPLLLKGRYPMPNALYGGHRPKLLAVDDDNMNLMLIKRTFQNEADVETKTSGPDALAWLAEHAADLVLLDLRMPGMDGFDVLRAMKSHAPTSHIPVIFLTGDIGIELESRGFVEGATDFVRKPFIPDVMRQRVRRVLHYEYLQDHLLQEVKLQTGLAEKRLEESQRLFEEMTIALAKTIDAKDKYTHGHSERVAYYSRLLAARNGEDESEQKHIYYMGLLHDIGKIGVPEEIINKPGKLTDTEYQIIQSHTTIGSDILKDIKTFPDLSIGARSHHERYDGRGYPDKLAGENIPQPARIIAVADAYDAMTSTRSYRKGLPQEAARAEIEKGRGTQFDPQIADLMLALIDADTEFTMRDHEE